MRLTGDETFEAAQYVEALGGRIEALARAHNQLTRTDLGPGDLRQLIETEAAVSAGDLRERVSINGEAALLQPGAFPTMTLVFHELLANSVRHGALSGGGRVEIQWLFTSAGDLGLHWRDVGGPAVQPPARKGFGSVIIERSIPYNLAGQVETRYPPAGFEADLVIPARHVRRGRESVGASAAAGSSQGNRCAAGTALIVEDSLLIAMSTEALLNEQGATAVIKANSVAKALAAIERQRPDFALLDVNLGAETSFPVADRLRADGVPYLFLTAYGEQLRAPAAHAGALVLQKPFTAPQLAAAVTRLRGATP